MLRTLFLTLFALTLSWGQNARALSSFEFLTLAPDAVTAARGETGIAWESHLAGLLLNPANLLLIEQEQVTLSWARRIAGINQFHAATTLTGRTGFPLAAGINSVYYGRLDGRDIWGNSTGTFTAQDIMLYIASAYQWRWLQLGGSGRLIYSGIDDFSCTAMALDLGTRYTVGSSGWDLGLVLQNAGIILSEYSSSSSTELPLRFRAGVAKRLIHLPLRWFLDYTLLGETEGELQLGCDFYLPIGWTLRGGYLFEQGSDRLESLDEALRGVTVGFGGELTGNWLIDYSFTTLGVLGSINRITFARRF